MAWFYFLIHVFRRILIKRDFLAIISRLKRRIIKRKSFNSKNLLINLCKDSILLLYLAWMIVIIVIIAKVIILVIDNCIKKFLASNSI